MKQAHFIAAAAALIVAGTVPAQATSPARSSATSPATSSATSLATAQAEATRTERVQFARGHSSATIAGELRGYDTVDYRIGVRAGQTVHVSMRGSNASGYFNVSADNDPEAIFVGSMEGNTFTGASPITGDLVVRVYLMRNAARRGEHLNYSLVIAAH